MARQRSVGDGIMDLENGGSTSVNAEQNYASTSLLVDGQRFFLCPDWDRETKQADEEAPVQ